MATYITSSCPHCQATLRFHQMKSQIEYGCPFKVCPKCGKGYFDAHVKEHVLAGAQTSDIKRVSIFWVLWFVFNIWFMGWGIYTWINPSPGNNAGGLVFFVGLVMCIILGCVIVSDWKNYASDKRYYAEQIRQSEKRMADVNYARALKNCGVSVPTRYLDGTYAKEWARKNGVVETEECPSLGYDIVDEATALTEGATNIKCSNCQRVQFKGNTTCCQCGAKFKNC